MHFFYLWRGLQNSEKRILASPLLFACKIFLSSLWKDFHKICYLTIFLKSFENFQLPLKSDKNIGYLTWRPVHIMLILRWILRRIRNISDKRCTENQKAHFMFNIIFFRSHVVYEIMWEIWYNQTGHRWSMRLECCVTKTTNTHSEYVILISFPRQQWLRPVAWMLHVHTRTLPLLFLYTGCW